MSSTVTTNFKYRQAKNFQDSLEFSSFYLFFSRPTPIDDTVPVPVNSLAERNDVWDNMIFAKRIYTSDISLAIRKLVWQSGTVYDAYDHTSDLSELDYFVVTSNGDVFKCIESSGASTVEPTPPINFLDIVETSDGYRWKYMRTVSSNARYKFETDDVLPVGSNNVVSAGAIPGTIDRVKTVESGDGYSANTSIPLYINGDGDVNETGTLSITSIDGSGAITAFNITDQGTSYKVSSVIPVLIKQNVVGSDTDVPLLTSAYGLATINALGKIESLQIVKNGSGYTSGATARIVACSVNINANTDEFGSITSFDYISSGINYRNADAVLVTDDTPTTPAQLTPIISPVNGHGYDAARELGATAVVFSSSVFNLGEKFFDDTSFRTMGILENPVSNSTGEVATADSVTTINTLKLNTPSSSLFPVGSKIFGTETETTATVIEHPSSNEVRYIKSYSDFNPLESIRTEDGSASAQILEIQKSDIKKYSGEILVINNTEIIARTPNQIETFKFIIYL